MKPHLKIEKKNTPNYNSMKYVMAAVFVLMSMFVLLERVVRVHNCHLLLINFLKLSFYRVAGQRILTYHGSA